MREREEASGTSFKDTSEDNDHKFKTKPVSTIVSTILEVAKIACGWECPGGLPLEVMFELSSEEGICISQEGRGIYTQACKCSLCEGSKEGDTETGLRN